MICGNCNQEIDYHSQTVSFHLDGDCYLEDRFCPCDWLAEEIEFERERGERDDEVYMTEKTFRALRSAATDSFRVIRHRSGKRFVVFHAMIGEKRGDSGARYYWGVREVA